MGKKRTRRRTQAEAKAIQLIKENPDASNLQIGRQLKELGLVSDPTYIYSLVKRNQKAANDISQIREKNAEILSRDIVPHALKLHKQVLKDKTIAPKDKLPWVKLAEDKEFGADDNRRPHQIPNIHIDQIQAIINTGNTQRLQELQGQDEDDNG